MRIKVDGVTKRYGDVTALDDVSIEIDSAETFGLLGTNGAGKTTLFKQLVGHDRPDEGHLYIGETEVVSAGRQVRELVGFLPQIIGFPPRLTGREVLVFTARARRMSRTRRRTRIPEVLETVGLTDAADRAVAGYSGGMRRRLGLAVAILANPPVLVLDEPTAGLDPEGVAEYHRVIERIKTENETTVLFSSHVLSEVESLCDSVAILHDGRLCATGTVDDLTRRTSEGTVVRLRVDDVAEVAPIAGTYGDVTTEDHIVEVTIEKSVTIDLLNAVESTGHLEEFELHTPGLERVFSDAIGEAIARSEAAEVHG